MTIPMVGAGPDPDTQVHWDHRVDGAGAGLCSEPPSAVIFTLNQDTGPLPWPPRPDARWRAQVVRYARPALDAHALDPAAGPRAVRTPRPWTWATLMRRVWDLDVLACPRCGGRLRLIAAVQDPAVLRPILAHLARADAPDPPRPVPIP